MKIRNEKKGNKKSMKSLENMLLQRIPNRDMRSKEIMKIRRTRLLRLNHIWGVFCHDGRAQILNLRIMNIHYSKIHIIKTSIWHQGTTIGLLRGGRNR
jgi:hypothetical protein